MTLLFLGLKQEAYQIEILQSNKIKERIRIPMVKNNRSLNLSNSVGIVIYEAWRQLEFESGVKF